MDIPARLRQIRPQLYAASITDDPDKAHILQEIGARFHDEFESTGQMIDSQRALEYYTLALEAAHNNEEGRWELMEKLALLYVDRFQISADADDLRQATKYFREVLQAASGEDVDHGTQLFNLATTVGELYHKSKSIADLEEAINYFEKALEVTSEDHLERGDRLAGLGTSLSDRFHMTNRMSDLERAIQCFKEALKLTDDEDPSYVENLQSLGNAFQTRFRKTEQVADLDRAMQYYQSALQATTDHDSDPGLRVENVGSVFKDRFELNAKIGDLEDAIKYYQQALDITPKNHQDMARRLDNLGYGFSRRYLISGEESDLEAAMENYRRALERTPEGHADRMERLGALGSVYGNKFQRKGQSADSECAIMYHQQALEASPEDHPDRGICFENLGLDFLARYRALGQIIDLEKAIKLCQQAFDITREDHPDKGRTSQMLGTTLLAQFERTNKRSDLDEAVQCFERALLATPESNPERADRFASLGNAHLASFPRTGLLNDLQQAVDCYQQGLLITTTTSIYRQMVLRSLGIAFKYQYPLTGNPDDLNRAIECYQQALKETPDGSSNIMPTLNSLALGFLDKFEETGAINDIEEAALYSQRAIEATPNVHPYRALQLMTHGRILGHRYDITHNADDRQKSTEAFKEATLCTASAPFDRIKAGGCLVQSLIREQRWGDCMEALQLTLQLLPDILPRTNSRQDMQHVLQQISGLAPISASIFLKAGASPYHALQALEQCLGIIASFKMDSSIDISMLKKKSCHLWSQYIQCQDELRSISRPLSENDVQDYSYTERDSEQKRLYKAIDELRAQIRKEPGLERFLLPLTEVEIRALAEKGPIVCFNVSEISSEAFIITAAQIEVLALPGLKLLDLAKHLQVLRSGGNPARRDANREEDGHKRMPNPGGYLRLRDATLYEEDEEQTEIPAMDSVLLSLWDNAVKPVLQRLEILDSSSLAGAKLSRVHWVGAGIMSLFPIHAAGDHSLTSTHNTLSQVISSYAPSLKALKLGQGIQQSKEVSRKHDILVIAMPKSPGGYKDLQVDKEVEAIEKLTGPSISVKAFSNPTKEDVLKSLGSFTIIHFACHGIANRFEPANSSLIVGKDTEERLTVEDIDSLDLKKAQIAYLSACSTAEIRTPGLITEGVHLANVFQLAGFQHVIGTLWGADDDAAVNIASRFYHKLLHEKNDIGDGSVAYALHEATMGFREEGWNRSDFFKWAPFIHLGC